MGANLSFQYPIWFVAFCILLGLGYALVLYYKDQTFREQSKWLNWLLGIGRFLAVTLISLLLLSPLLKSLVTETQKPIIVIAQDNSESIKMGMQQGDSTTYATKMNALAASLEEDYDLKQYSFGSEIRDGFSFDYKDKVTNVSNLLNEVYDLYSNQNLGAVVIATDGIYNQGSNPIYAGAKLNVPVYTIALGDTTVKRDISIKRVYHNKIAYLGDKFSIQVDISARNCQGELTNLTVSKVGANGSTKLKTVSTSINTTDFFKLIYKVF